MSQKNKLKSPINNIGDFSIKKFDKRKVRV